MEPVRVGVIGVGHLGYHHARICAELSEAELVGVVDINEERAAAVGEDMSVPYFTDIDHFFEVAKPDAVSIVVPTSLHYEIACKAIKLGANVLIEKPVTTTVEEAEELLRLAAEKRCVLQVGHVERFNGAVQYVRKILNPPHFIQSRRMGPFTPRATDVGVVMDLMIHDIDIILSLVHSEISSISALGRSIKSDFEDVASAQMAFTNGAMAHILVSRVAERRLRTLEIMEPTRYITLNYETQDVTIYRCVRQNGRGLVEIVEHPVFPKYEPLRLELQHFVLCVKEGRQPLVGIADGKRALEVAIAILRQIHQGGQNGSIEAVAST